MAIISIPKKEIEKIAKINETLIEKINLMGTPVEAVKDKEIEIEVLPNRPDMLSSQGFLRAFSSYMGKETGLKKYAVNRPEKDFKVKIDASLKSVRPYTACAVVKNLKFDDEKIKEIIDLQEKMHAGLGRNRKKIAIGIYPLEKIKLPIRFEARKPEEIKFIPLESEREMNGRQILSSHPTGRDYAHLLEGYDKFPVFVDANNEILSMPPIINSHKTGKITENTREIFIECSGFDFKILKKTLNIIVTTFADMGGKIYSMELDYGKKEITPDLSPEKMHLSVENFNKLIGLELKEKDLGKLLSKMGYEYKSGNVLVPAWRTDVLHEVDIIEDAAIAYGYNNLSPEIPKVATIGEQSVEEKIKSKIAEILLGLGMTEISTYHMIKEDEAKIFRLDDKEKIELENSKTEYKFLRNNLMIPALRTLAENKDNEYPQNVFEIGTSFNIDETKKEESGIKEAENLCICMANSALNFTDIKQVFDYLARMTGIEYKLEEAENSFFIKGRCAKIIVNKKEIGHMGEISPQILENLKIKMPICALEINIETLIN